MNPAPLITRTRCGLTPLNRKRHTRAWSRAAMALFILSILAGALALANL